MPTDGEILRLINLLVQAFERQLQNYLKLEAAVEELGAYLETSDRPDDDRLGEITAAQQAHFKKVGQTDDRIQALKRRLEELVGSPEINLTGLRAALTERRADKDHWNAVDRLEQFTVQLVEVIRRIQDKTDANEAKLKKRLGSLSGDLKQVHQGMDAARAYKNLAKGVPRPASFLDEKK